MGQYNKKQALALMKTRLNRAEADTSLDPYFAHRIEAAAEKIERKGIVLTDSSEDLMLIVDQAVWDYQNRDKNAGTPEWLRQAIRDRWVNQDVT